MNVATARIPTPGGAARAAVVLGLLLVLSACHLGAPYQRGYLKYSGQHQFEYGSRGQHHHKEKRRHRSRY